MVFETMPYLHTIRLNTWH